MPGSAPFVDNTVEPTAEEVARCVSERRQVPCGQRRHHRQQKRETHRHADRKRRGPHKVIPDGACHQSAFVGHIARVGHRVVLDDGDAAYIQHKTGRKGKLHKNGNASVMLVQVMPTKDVPCWAPTCWVSRASPLARRKNHAHAHTQRGRAHGEGHTAEVALAGRKESGSTFLISTAGSLTGARCQDGCSALP